MQVAFLALVCVFGWFISIIFFILAASGGHETAHFAAIILIIANILFPLIAFPAMKAANKRAEEEDRKRAAENARRFAAGDFPLSHVIHLRVAAILAKAKAALLARFRRK